MKERVCTDCGTVARPIRVTKGSIGMELVLWLCFILPGLIYSLWRLSSRFDGCPVCKSARIVPLDSPIGKKLSGLPEDTGPKNDRYGRSIGQMVVD